MTKQTSIDLDTYLADMKARQLASWPEGLSREIAYPLGERPLSEHLSHWAQTRPDAPSIFFYGSEVSWAELNAQANRFAALLAARGLRKGDRVAVFMPNCPQFHIAFFGILKAGLVHVPISPLSTATEVEYVLNDTDATLIVTIDALVPIVETAKGDTALREILSTPLAALIPENPTIHCPDSVMAPAKKPSGTTDFLAALSQMPDAEISLGDLDSPAALNYTGGTTGMPKGCVHTQRDMVFTGAANWAVTSDREEGVSLTFFPEFWIAGENMALIFPLMTGEPLVLLTRWDPLSVLQAIEAYRVTVFGMIVDGAIELMNRPDFKDFDLSSLTRVRVVSFVKKLDPDIRARWNALTGTILAEASWGMTETHTSNTFTTDMQDDDFDLKQQPVFVGLPLPENEFVIRDFETGQILPPGSEGEITMRSPGMLKSYWGKPGATAEAIRDGFLYTGDIGVLDEMGYLHYLGRRKEMLKVRGMSVFPAEIEATLGKHPGVQGSGVVGRADARSGQIPVAFVQPADPDLSAQALTDWLAERISKYKLPEIRLVDSLPMTATGKVRKAELADWVENESN
ncbi:AMP-dependent synthetase and ligase [Sulfitobacter noctilucae]|uniref:AMP-binding protein n=1 Tax=Sulfitobacter noctilucae TaxID=1342302 RepID=UPI000468E3DE|nr:AMP-binding protein [Sulfitobacter noctilucae]KIN60565.1 AMP-dependent synthetase and ligase [Sulfitobacter noctilucae]